MKRIRIKLTYWIEKFALARIEKLGINATRKEKYSYKSVFAESAKSMKKLMKLIQNLSVVLKNLESSLLDLAI